MYRGHAGHRDFWIPLAGPLERQQLLTRLKEVYANQDLGTGDYRSIAPVDSGVAAAFCTKHELPFNPDRRYTVNALTRALGKAYLPRSTPSLKAQYIRLMEEAEGQSAPRSSLAGDAGPIDQQGTLF
ncbi:MAG: hypothetical protein HY369_03745 [Candidatus Aenigmarchaeota archaeon]|nr:hypothetical protein [Candidatus Aenigmarchaeota archaeon]